MANGRENATQLNRMTFYIARSPFSNLNINCLFYIYRMHCLLNLRRVKQANIGKRFKCTNHKASFNEGKIRSVYKVEYNLHPKENLSFFKFNKTLSSLKN